MKKIGFTIGKFAPLHKGHMYLIEKAINEMDEVYALVYETDVIDIPVEQRANWIKQIYPNINVVIAKNPPRQIGLDEESVKIQNNYLKDLLKNIPVTHFYSSEQYGEYVAKEFKIENILVDKNRANVPISATKIRNDLNQYKEYIDNRIYDDIEKMLKDGKENYGTSNRA